ncbi:MAG: endonuclease domain-containing protein [Acutalibacteraceae bacterium]
MKSYSSLKQNAQKLRKEMTKEERHLWYDFLKNLPCTVKRQKVIGHFIVDFYIDSAKIVIEIDGSQHYESEKVYADKMRDAYLTECGLTVLRYSNADVNQNFDSVCEDILNHIK